MVLLPCAASSTWTWVNQLLTLVQWLGWCRTTTYYNFETLSHLGHLCVRFAMTSWRSTERLGDFSSESVVSHLVSWVSSWVVLVCFWLVLVFGCVCFVFYWKTPGLLLSPILQHVGIANQRQYVLMTVWASSAHGMSSKKKYRVLFLYLCSCPYHVHGQTSKLLHPSHHHGHFFLFLCPYPLRFSTLSISIGAGPPVSNFGVSWVALRTCSWVQLLETLS